MDISRLQISIPRIQTSIEDASTCFYHIFVIYGKLNWNVPRRFSEFIALYEALDGDSYGAVPLPPAKTITRPQDPTFLEGRRALLQLWLRAVCARPDMRTSQPLLDFIEFELQTGSTVPRLAPLFLCQWKDERFQLADFVFNEAKGVLFTANSEAASLARLGRVWSVVEQDQLGSVNAWDLSGRELLQDRLTNEIQSSRTRGIFYHSQTGRLFVASDTGHVQVFSTDNVRRGELVKERDLSLHTEAILSLQGDDSYSGRFITVGYDSAIRIVNCSTLETLCGGRLNKRLQSTEKLSVAIIEKETNLTTNNCRIFIGSTHGTVFIYSASTNPPLFISSLQFDSSITALEMAGTNLVVAHKYQLSIYRVGNLGDEKNATCIATLEPQLTQGRTIRCIAISRTTPFLFLGHSYCFSIWNCYENSCVSVIKSHYDGIRKIQIIENSTDDGSSIQILTGGTEGCVKLWQLSPAPEYTVWNVISEKTETINSSVSTKESPNKESSTVQIKDAESLVSHTGSLQVPPLVNNTTKFESKTSRIQFSYEDDDDLCLMPTVSAVPHRH